MTSEDHIIYRSTVSKFTQRVWNLYAPYLVICFFFGLLIFFNVRGNRPVIVSWLFLDLVIAIILFRCCYKWAINKITSVAQIEGGLEIEMVEKDKRRRSMVKATNLKVVTKQIGRGRLSLFKLALFNKEHIIIEVYSTNGFKDLSELEKLKYEINKYLN